MAGKYNGAGSIPVPPRHEAGLNLLVGCRLVSDLLTWLAAVVAPTAPVIMPARADLQRAGRFAAAGR